MVGALEPGYSHLDRYVSELAAANAENPVPMAIVITVWGLSIAAVGLAIRPLLPRTASAWVLVALFALGGIAGALAGPFRIDCGLSIDERCIRRTEAGELSFAHYAHLWLALAAQVSLALTPFALAYVFRGRPIAWLGVACGASGVTSGIVVWVIQAEDLLPNGLVQRVQLAGLHLWVCAFAAAALLSRGDGPR